MPEIICKVCGDSRHVKPHVIRDGKGKFCSRKCYDVFKKTDEHKEKLKNWFGSGGRANRGIKRSRKFRINLSVRIRAAHANGTFLGFRGRKHTKTERMRRSLVRLGKPNFSIRGRRSGTWKGGVTPKNHKIRTSLRYKMWRCSVFKRDNWTCQLCFKRGRNLNADHIKPFALFPELRFELSNGRTLCEKCHKKTDTYMNSRMKRSDFETA